MAKEEREEKDDEIPDVSKLARQQPPKSGSNEPMKGAFAEAGKLEYEGKMPHERFHDKMAKSLCE